MITELFQVRLKHTFLLEESVWKASGEYYNEENCMFPVSGWTRVQHQIDHWYIANQLALEHGQGIDLQSQCVIQPARIQPGCVLNWSSDHCVLGEVRGHFVLQEDAILTQFGSVDGRYRGNNLWLQEDDCHYRMLGMLMDGNRKHATWRMEIMRARVALC